MGLQVKGRVMSDEDLSPDPVDKAYAQAEALLGDEAARGSRRAKVLAAVAETAAPAVRAQRPAAWPRAVWLTAAGIAGVALVVASQSRLADRFRLQTPPPPPAKAPALAVAPSIVPPASPLEQPPALPPPPPRPPNALSPLVIVPPPAPPVASAPTVAPSLRTQSPPPPPSPSAAAAGPAEVSEVVATGSYIKGAPEDASIPVEVTTRSDVAEKASGALSANVRTPAPGRLAAPPNDVAVRLRAAAAAGRIVEVNALLAQGAVVDAPDEGGNTALMKSIQANHPDLAAALRRRGASLDVKNRAGQSARDMATALGDAKLNQALGLTPPMRSRRVD